MTDVISKSEAKARGLKVYFTGKPCKQGHVSERFTCSGICKACNVEICKALYHKDPEATKRRAKQRYWSDPEKARAQALADYRKHHEARLESQRVARSDPEFREYMRGYLRRYYLEHKAERVGQSKAQRAANPERNSAYQKKYRDKNRELKNLWTANRRARKKHATPPWSDMDSIKALYLARPEGHEVDHIVPLKGITADGLPVSGLHVPANLRYLPSKLNSGRCNRMTADDMRLVEAA